MSTEKNSEPIFFQNSGAENLSTASLLVLDELLFIQGNDLVDVESTAWTPGIFCNIIKKNAFKVIL